MFMLYVATAGLDCCYLGADTPTHSEAAEEGCKPQMYGERLPALSLVSSTYKNPWCPSLTLHTEGGGERPISITLLKIS